MNQHQIRAIKAAFQRDTIFSRKTECLNYLDAPIMRKKLDDVILLGKPLKKHNINPDYELKKGDNIYILYTINFGHTSQTMWIITKNNIIIYYCFSSIFAPASSAWHILTEVYHGYGTGMRSSCWTWQSAIDFNCKYLGFSSDWRNKEANEKWYFNLQSDYQKKMFEKTGESYVDKRIISKEKAEELAAKEYYWT